VELLKGGGWGRSTWKDGLLLLLLLLLLLPAVANQWATHIPLTPHASFTPPIHTDTLTTRMHAILSLLLLALAAFALAWNEDGVCVSWAP